MSPLPVPGKCPVCGYESGRVRVDPNYLPPGSLLAGRYIVGRLSSSNPEGAWYVGYDKQAGMRVWLREYVPRAIARRAEDYSLMPKQNAEAQYKALMSDFEDLCRSLQRLSPNEKVIPVLDIMRANNTVYAVYRYIKTITFDSFLQRSGGKLSWRQTKKLMMPLFHTVAAIHKAGIIHRGLAPLTVHMDQSGVMWLSGFSIAAARTNKSELSAQLFEGYAAPEQYSLNSWQGTWTDVYALGALLYRAVSGQNPPSAQDRVYGDDLLEANQTFCDDLTPAAMKAINHALAVEIEERTSVVEALISECLANEASNTAVYTAPPSKRRPEPLPEFSQTDGKTMMMHAAPTEKRPVKLDDEEQEPEDKRMHKEKRKKQHPIILGVFSTLVAVIALGCVVFWVAATYLPDLLHPGTSNVSAPGGNNASQETGSDFSSDSSQADGTLPRFIGSTVSSIKQNAALQHKYQFVIEEKFNAAFDEGVVYGQDPQEGSDVAQGGTVTLYVSKGADMVEMPKVIDLPIDEAVQLLESLEINYQIIERYNNSYEPGIVVHTDKPEGTKIDKERDTVTLFIKKESTVEEPTSSEVESIPDMSEPSDQRDEPSSSSRRGNGVVVIKPSSSSTGLIKKPKT